MKGRTPPGRLAVLSLLATVLGLLGGVAAFVLIRLIALLTNVALFHRIAWTLPDMAELPRGPGLVIVAMASGLVVSLLARWSPEIRGHGIPEAMDAVLTKQSRIHPRTAIAKPLSAAIAIGAGGPFGAEGPIIVTGGALGSLLGQVFSVSPSERKVLLASGAAAGMAATFGTPLAAVVLVIELLLFEFTARAFVPLVVSTALAAGVHSAIFGSGPLFEVPTHDYHGLGKLPYFAVLGLCCGMLAVVIARGLFVVERAYRRLPVSEFWHPIIGALGFALIGLVEPRALGVGYDVIDDVLLDRIAVAALAGLALAKLLAWWVALGSGTSGGTLAPVLLISGAFGSLFGTAVHHLAPGANIAPGAFALVAMAATFGSAVGASFAAIVFLFELTRDYQIILPLMLATVIADVVARSLMHDDLMTEKLTRRGVHVESDFTVDALAGVTVGEVMTTTVDTLTTGATTAEVRRRIQRDGHGAYPIVDTANACVAIIAREDVLELDETNDADPALAHANTDVVSVGPDTPLEVALRLLLEEGIGHLPVVDGGMLVGMCTRTDILRARHRRLDDESRQPGWRQSSPEPVRRGRRPTGHDPDLQGGHVWHYLIVGNQTLGGAELAEALAERLARGPSRFFVLVPATRQHDLYGSMLNALEGTPQTEQATAEAAERRLSSSLAWIRERGGTADGVVGDPNPLAAISEVLATQHFDEIIVSTLPTHVSKWLRIDLPSRVAHAVGIPVVHVAASRFEPAADDRERQ